MTGVPGPLDSLTPRQREVLITYGRLGGTKAVAHELGIRQRTVARHAAAARERLSVDALVQAVAAIAAIAGGPSFDPCPDAEPSATLSAMDTTGPDLRAARRRAGLTQAQLAARLGLCRQRLSAAEGALRVSPAFAARYAEALDG